MAAFTGLARLKPFPRRAPSGGDTGPALLTPFRGRLAPVLPYPRRLALCVVPIFPRQSAAIAHLDGVPAELVWYSIHFNERFVDTYVQRMGGAEDLGG